MKSLVILPRNSRIEVLEDRRVLATLTVNVASDAALTTDGEGLDDGMLTLREAMAVVNETYDPLNIAGDLKQIDETVDLLGENDRIVFSSDDFPIDGVMQTIQLAHGEIALTERFDGLDIIGPGSNELTISARLSDPNLAIDGDGTRIFHFERGNISYSADLSGMTLTKGDVDGEGGAVRANMPLTFKDMVFLDNTAAEGGGAVFANYDLHISDSRFVGNATTAGNGGAIEADSRSHDFSLHDSAVINNTAWGDGGGVYIDGMFSSVTASSVGGNTATHGEGGGVWFESKSVRIEAVSVYNNTSAGDGGGVYLDVVSAIIDSSTVSDNTSGARGGALFMTTDDAGSRPGSPDFTTHVVEHVTVTGNVGVTGGGIFSALPSVLISTIVSGNSDTAGVVGGNVVGQLDSRSEYNLLGPSSVSGLDLTTNGNIEDAGNDPLLDLIVVNGSHAYLPSGGSSAIDNGGRTWVFNPDDFDQRGLGHPRGYDGYADIGAIETPGLIVTPPSTNSLSAVVPNLDLENFTFLPQYITAYGGSLYPVDEWYMPSMATSDSYNRFSFPNGGFVDGLSPPPDGSSGYVGLGSLSNWNEYIAATTSRTLMPGESYKLNLYAGISSVAPDSRSFDYFDGELVVYGVTDADLLPWNSTGEILGHVELLSLPLSLSGKGEWTGWPTQTLDIPVPVEAIVVGLRTATLASEYKNYYLHVDMSIPRDKLLGDFSGNGIVDAADYTIWRDTFNNEEHPHFGADHSGDGVVGEADYLIWVETYGSSLRFLGDYNGDDEVNAADYTVWADTFGQTVVPGSGADGDGDGEITRRDYTVWANNYGASLTAAPDPSAIAFLSAYAPGDFNDDGSSDYGDYLYWEATLGTTVPKASGADSNANGRIDLNDLAVWQKYNGLTTLPDLYGDFNGDGVVDTDDLALWDAGDPMADANLDGIVDVLDFNIWADQEGMIHASAWPILTDAVGGGSSNQAGAPQVVGISVGLQGGGVHDLGALAGSGEQLRSVPLPSVDHVSLSFSEQVLLKASDLLVVNLDGTGSPTVTGLTYNLSTNTATWTFDGPLTDGRHLLRLEESVLDLDGDSLVREFENPWTLSSQGAPSIFGGKQQDAFRFRFTVLAGDTDRDNVDGSTDYTNWVSIEPGMIYVSRTNDEWDSDLSFGDVSLREAVNHANLAGVPTMVVLPTGRYMITRAGGENTNGHDISKNDLNILGDVRVVGDGAGYSVIDMSQLSVNAHRRAFEVMGGGASLDIDGVTITDGSSYYSFKGVAAKVHAGSSLLIQNSSIVNNFSLQEGTAVYSLGGDLTIRRSVFTNNESVYKGGQAIYAIADGSTGGSLTIGESIFAINWDRTPSGNSDPNVLVGAGVALTNEGKNLYDDATGGFFDTTPGVDDYQGTPDYVVSTLVDDWDHTDDLQSLSIREAVDLANQASGSSEIWLPAWDFTLTRDRATYGGGSLTDTDVAFGDLDVSESVVIRGIKGRTSVSWKGGVVDDVFDLLGDAAKRWDGPEDTVDSHDLWMIDLMKNNNFYTEDTDINEDGVVDQDDYDLAYANLGNTLDLFDIAL